jgi:signal transduction histidine kinase
MVQISSQVQAAWSMVAGPIRARWQIEADFLVAALLCVLDLLVSWDGTDSGFRVPAYAALGYAVLGWRRRAPIWVFVALLVHAVLAWPLTPEYVPTLGVLWAMYTLAAHRGRQIALAGLAASFMPTALNVAGEVRTTAADQAENALIVSAVLGSMLSLAVFAVGRWVAWGLKQRQVEAMRAAQAAVATERSRIAVELHDLVAHSISVMLLQAAGAARVMRRDPLRAEAALKHVDEFGQEAIVELRRLLGLLSHELDGAGDSTGPGGLADVLALVERLSAASDLDIRLEFDGPAVPVEAGVDLAGYRIVQEALTNAVKYADRRAPVQVRVSWRRDAVELRIKNDIGHVPVHYRLLSTSQGIIGMRERVRIAGGSMEAGPVDDSGFLVRATFPTLWSRTSVSDRVTPSIVELAKGHDIG